MVVFVNEPPCVLVGATGMVADADPNVTLACEGVFLSELTISGPTAPDLVIDPAATTYEADLSLLQSEASITAVLTHAEASVTINGVAVNSGVASAPLALDLGENVIEVVVAGPGGGTRTYNIIIRRAIEIAQAAYTKASNTGAEDRFGVSVALSGDTLAIGAHSEDSAATGINGDQDNDAAPRGGAVYVFRRSGTSWSQEAYIKASNTGQSDRFGFSVALSGDTLAVSAYDEDSNATGINGDQDNDDAQDSGAVYVFRRSGTDWTQEAYIKASNTDASDQFGISIALSGDTLAVGAYLEDSAATGIDGDQDRDDVSGSGAVYVFRRDGTNWSQEAYIKASNTDASDRFGVQVALSGDTLAVGGYLDDSAATGIGGDQDSNDAANSGAVYVFTRAGITWSQEAYIKASNANAGDEFGFRVAVSGDTLAVGALKEDSNSTRIGGDQGNDDTVNSGAVYVFRRSGTNWSQVTYIKASNTDTEDRFGYGIALSNDTLVATSRSEDSAATHIDGDQHDNSATDSGAAYIFY